MSSDDAPPSKRRKKDDSQIGSRGWDLMRKMGWVAGAGLGAQGQGRLEPVATKIPKRRQGLGADASLQFRALEAGEVPKGPNAWSEDNADLTSATADDDLFFRFSWWLPQGSNCQLPDLSLRCLEALQSAILPPDSPSAHGPPILQLESQSRYCSEEVLFEMLFYKNSLDKRAREAIASARLRSNPYENIHSGIFMNRAAMKMANMDFLFRGLFSEAVASDEILHFADICAGPGGFSEYLTWRRGCPLNMASKRSSFQRIRGYGMTLKGDCDFKFKKFIAGPVETFRAYYGDDGDITKWANLAFFARTIVAATAGKGVHVVMADGGFDVSDSYNLQEVKSKHIYLCQCLCALTILRPGGHFVTKLFDTFTDFTVDLIWLMSHVFKKIYIVKPITSRPANSERYLVCDGLISPNDCMAGCPAAPPSANGNHKKDSPKNQEYKRKPGQKSSRAMSYHHPGGAGDTQEDGFQLDTTSAVGVLINHFLAAGEELHNLAQYASEDLLRLAQDDVLHAKESFPEFITMVNEKLAKRQCLYLSKMILFADDATKSDESQSELAKVCLEKWQVPTIKRESLCWPLWSENLSSALRGIIPDPTNFRTASLPDHLSRPEKINRLKAEDLNRSAFQPASFHALVVADLHSATVEQPNNPIMLLSLGNRRILTWEYGKFVDLNLDIHLPAGCLIWALNVNIYSNKGLRYRALMVLDAALIYGIDIQSLPFFERMAHIKALCDTLDFPETKCIKIICPPCEPLIKVPAFIGSLKVLPCKDFPDGHVMFQATKSGMTCAPRNLILVQHLSPPWTIAISRSSGRPYYLNPEISQSTYDLPPDVGLPFSGTKFFRVPWTKGPDSDFDVDYLLQWLKMHS